MLLTCLSVVHPPARSLAHSRCLEIYWSRRIGKVAISIRLSVNQVNDAAWRVWVACV